MKTEFYPHKIAAVYSDRATAEAAIKAIDANPPGMVKVTQLAPGAPEVDLAVEPEAMETRNTAIIDTVAGGVAGTGVGAVVAGVAAIAMPALFTNAPLIGPLVMLGYGGMIGGIAGSIRGLKLGESMLAGLVKDALKAGYHVVVVHAASHKARRRARNLIDETMAEETVQS